MTFQEKLILVLYKSHSANYTAELLEKEADSYAIEFGAWILRNFNNYEPNDEKELLEIFKKEKGL
jgi:hypothetical protein